jgi:hypothetical protein
MNGWQENFFHNDAHHAIDAMCGWTATAFAQQAIQPIHKRFPPVDPTDLDVNASAAVDFYPQNNETSTVMWNSPNIHRINFPYAWLVNKPRT